jgi:hypothetical protein
VLNRVAVFGGAGATRPGLLVPAPGAGEGAGLSEPALCGAILRTESVLLAHAA